MKDFETIGREIQAERQKEWSLNAEKRRQSGEDIYIEYLVYCHCYDTPRADYKAFHEWLTTKTDYKLTFWQAKYLKEKYFGYKYIYNKDKKDWEITNEQNWNIKKK